MTTDQTTPFLGLPWPSEYEELQVPIREQWAIEGDIYLGRQLSGKSGALVFAADLTCSGFAGQAILKLDQAPDPELLEDDEAARHARAFERAPDYSAVHLPRVLHTLHHGQSIAILSTIAGRGLTYATPWELCPHGLQLQSGRRLSKGLLEDWNADYQLPAGMMRPQDLLSRWLGDRLDPNVSKIFDFLGNQCGIAPDQPSVIFQGSWYPNPLAFALSDSDTMEGLRQRAVRGNVHGDLNGHNVLVGGRSNDDDGYYLIDLAHYDADQYLFFDNEYVGFSHLLAEREQADDAHWESLLSHVCQYDGGRSSAYSRGDDLGLIEIMQTLRKEAVDWIDRHEANRLSFLEDQLTLARVAVGLNFASKGIEARLRRLGFLYAAACLRAYMDQHGLDWPRHGPQFVLDAATPQSDVLGGSPSNVDDAHPELPDKTAIAVLPFENLSGDPEQEYFADGITEEIRTMLSRTDWLMVISRGSTFAYKGRGVAIKQIARELGVHYVVEGTVQKAGSKVRVTVQLTDGVNGHQLWSERYHRDIDDMFALQEEIAEAIGASLDIELRLAEGDHAHRMSSHVGIWDMFQKGMWHFFKYTDDDTQMATTQLRQLIERAPSFAPAHATLALLATREVLFGSAQDVDELLDRASHHAKAAVACDDRNSYAHMALARVLVLQGDLERAIEQARTAIELNPNSSGARLTLAHGLIWQGSPEEALSAVDASIRLSPRGPLRDFKLTARAFALYLLDRLDEAEIAARKVANGYRFKFGGLLVLAAILARQGRLDEAREASQQLTTLRPDATVSWVNDTWRGLNLELRERFGQDLSKAGLPA